MPPPSLPPVERLLVYRNSTPRGPSEITPKSFYRVDSNSTTYSKEVGVSFGGYDCMNGIFVKLGFFTQNFSVGEVKTHSNTTYLTMFLMYSLKQGMWVLFA